MAGSVSSTIHFEVVPAILCQNSERTNKLKKVNNPYSRLLLLTDYYFHEAGYKQFHICAVSSKEGVVS